MIYGDTVALRLVEEEDLPLLVRWRTDPRSPAVLYRPFPNAELGGADWYDALVADATRMQFMIERPSDHATIGTLGLQRIDYRNQHAEVVPPIMAPSELASGSGIDALRTMIHYAFRDLNLHRLSIGLIASLEAGCVTAAQAGFEREGTYRQAAFVEGAFRDVHLMAVLREEWEA